MSKEKKNEEMNMSEMIALFQKVFFKESSPFVGLEDNSNYYEYQSDSVDDEDDYDDIDDDDDDDDDDEDDDDSDDDCDLLVGCSCNHVLLNQSLKDSLKTKVSLKEKEAKAAQNGMELVAEEEKEKRKAEKRRAKKKRRKLKKKQEKDEAQKNKIEADGDGEEARAQVSSSSASEEEDLDPSSAFVAVVANKKLNSGSLHASNQKRNEALLRRASNDAQSENSTNLQNIDPIVLQSRQLAIRGNQMAAMDEYQAAISFFTAAIKLDPQDFRYFGNRSYCYERTDQYDRALKDADRAITLASSWPKGHFRKGRALFGLKRYAEAEECFQEVIKLDKNCSEAFTELIVSRTSGIMEMGFSKSLAEAAATKYDNLQTAVNALVAESANMRQGWGGIAPENCSQEDNDVYQSDDELVEDDFFLQAKGSSKDEKMDPKNPLSQSSLWVGNLKKEATEKSITNLFGKYGELVSVRVLPDSRCAFINYKTARAASRAMEALQGFEYFGEHLLIRFPDHQHTLGQSSVTVLKKKTPTAKTKAKESFDFKGPINGDECYFWRMSGCIHGSKCRYRHVPKHKGVDLK